MLSAQNTYHLMYQMYYTYCIQYFSISRSLSSHASNWFLSLLALELRHSMSRGDTLTE